MHAAGDELLRTDTGDEVTPVATRDRVGKIEAHGIDVIADDERHGRPRELFSVWAAQAVNFVPVIIGGALILLGLSVWQAVAVAIVGNLCAVGAGVTAVSGPASGTPSEVVTRALFGVRGNRVNVAITAYSFSLCYVAIIWATGALAGFTILERFGMTVSDPVKVVVILAIAAVTLVISVYGHATIVRVYVPLTIVLAVIFAVLSGFVLGNANWSYQPAEPLQGTQLWAALTVGFVLVAATPLSFSNSADFARYLPRSTSAVSVAGWTAAGLFVPSVILTVVGVLAGTAVDMTDPQAALAEILPSWLMPIFLFSIVIGSVASNATTTYSSGLALQSVGVRLPREITVLIDGAIGVALTLYALLISNFLDTVSSLLELLAAVVGPLMAIYVCDILLRRNVYDGEGLADCSPSSPYWYTKGVNIAGWTALIVGSTAALMSINTLHYVGPIAVALDGVDISLLVGMGMAATLYIALTRALYRSPNREN